MSMLLLNNEISTSIGIKSRLLLWLILPVIFILMITGYITYRVSRYFINIALERTFILQTRVLAHKTENFLEQCRQDLLLIAQDSVDLAKMRRFLANMKAFGGISYCQIAYISQKDKNHLFLAADGDDIFQIPVENISELRPNPFLFYEQIKNSAHNEVWLSGITESEYPFPTPSNPNRKVISKVISFITPYYSEQKESSGYLILSVDVRHIRNILSVLNSPKSPLWAFPRTDEVRYSYMFDTEGWILFQSEDVEKPDKELSTDLARSGFTGTLGRPDLSCGFKPSSAFGYFWKMIDDIKTGSHDIVGLKDPAYYYEGTKEYYLAYAPIRFSPGSDAKSYVYGGIAHIDRSRLTIRAVYKQMDVMVVVTLSTIILVSLLIYFLSDMITKPILKLTEAVNSIQKTGKLEEIRLSSSGYETSLLQNAINSMIATMKQQMEEIRKKEKEIERVSLKEKAPLEEHFPEIVTEDEIPEIVGLGHKTDRLKSDILKAAQADVDVLIIGETGTGKQLTAEAIHRHSKRSEMPFISINCGELDENLQLDTLFGHVKGAFTEAKTDRKGAFLEAHGGTLFLDEIQAASPSVQQALLRATAMRKIKPLGSDKETDVDVRLIAATNADLNALIDHQKFRSDLYFRLKVITIHTIPLRDQKENIPVLVRHFLNQAKLLTHKEELGLSKGALEKMKRYEWPGNVRELMNCIIRAVVMAENRILQAEDIKLDINPSELQQPVKTELPPVRLNRRQEKAYPEILKKNGVTRSEYEEIIGGKLSPRTAQHDLQDLVKKGVLIKAGQGPATRYVPTEYI